MKAMTRAMRKQWTRRDALRLIGSGAGIGVAGVLQEETSLLAWLQRGGGQNVRFPRGAVIRTLLKDLPPDALSSGPTLFHEHLSINIPPPPGRGGAPPAPPGAALPAQRGAVPPAAPVAPASPPPPGSPPQIVQPAAGPPAGGQGGRQGGPPLPPITDDVEMIIQLVNKAGSEGVACIVDGGHRDMGTRLADLKTIAARTKVHIVASGGYYMERTYPADLATKSEEQIADELAREARDGRFGAFGEIGQNPNTPELSLIERKVLRAIGKAHRLTGLPIFTHNSYGTGPNVPRGMGLQQLDVLESVGVDPAHVTIGHTCCLDDPEAIVIREIARRGAFVGFDRVTTVQQIMSDEKKVAMVLAFLNAGHADKLLLAADFTGQRTLEAGPGYGRTVTIFGPLLRKAGVGEETLHTILYDNPRRFLAFVPKRG
jgi:phosphotriesterase-related protein